jgi:thymus-specific serine protease
VSSTHFRKRTTYRCHSFFSRNLELENLQYLDIDQTLEDLAHFIRYQKTAIPGASDSGVILVGGHYAGSLAAWFLQRYPNLANGAWSSSAPLKAQVDFSEYKEVVGLAIRTVAGQPCYNRIQRAFDQIRSAMAESQFSMLDSMFNTCTSLAGASEFDRLNFMDSISNILSEYVEQHSGTEIFAACETITDVGVTSDLTAFVLFVRKLRGLRCLGYRYQDMVDFLKTTTWDSLAVKISCESL